MKTKINDIQLGYDDFGRGPALVLIHGFGLNRTIWLNMAHLYLKGFRVILPDVRGHGESDAPSGVYDMSLLAQDLAGLLDHLGVGSAVVAGHSMGGYIALAFAEICPKRLAGLGLITTRTEADSPEKSADRFQMVREVQEQGASALADSLAPRLSDHKAIIQSMHKMISGSSPQGIIGALKGMAERPDRTRILATLQVPALVAAGEQDKIISLEKARTISQLLRQGHFVSLKKAGHMPMLEVPSILAGAFKKVFLES